MNGPSGLWRSMGDPAPPGTADIHLGLSKIYREQGLLDAAQEEMQKSETLGEKAGLGDWPYRLRRAQAQVQGGRGRSGRCARSAGRGRTASTIRSPVPDVRPIAALKAQVWLAQGRLADALAWARGRGLSVDDELSYLQRIRAHHPGPNSHGPTPERLGTWTVGSSFAGGGDRRANGQRD